MKKLLAGINFPSALEVGALGSKQELRWNLGQNEAWALPDELEFAKTLGWALNRTGWGINRCWHLHSV